MESFKQDLEMLYQLQSYDTNIDSLKKQIREAFTKIEFEKKYLQDKHAGIESQKKSFTELNSLKNEKESLLSSKEDLINKRSLGLNKVKSNDTYKALLLELEKTKQDKCIIEDEILQLMYKIDKEIAIIRELKNNYQDFETKVKNNITEIESSIENLKNEISSIEAYRKDQESRVSKPVFLQYERIREGGDGVGIILIDGESCGACSMMLRLQLINQAQKFQELVYCDHCSKILYKRA